MGASEHVFGGLHGACAGFGLCFRFFRFAFIRPIFFRLLFFPLLRADATHRLPTRMHRPILGLIVHQNVGAAAAATLPLHIALESALHRLQHAAVDAVQVCEFGGGLGHVAQHKRSAVHVQHRLFAHIHPMHALIAVTAVRVQQIQKRTNADITQGRV